jgi:hypothetical protein
MIRRAIAILLALAFIASALPGPVAAVSRDEGMIAGTTAPSRFVRLRNVDTGMLVATVQSDQQGLFVFQNLPPGNYLLELLDASGAISSASSPITISSAGQSVTGISLRPASSSKLGFFTRTPGILLLGAATAGSVVGIIAVKKPASPKQKGKPDWVPGPPPGK